LPKLRIASIMDRLSSKRSIKYAVYGVAVALFFGLILLPPILGIITNWNTMQQVLDQPQLVNRALSAVGNSFGIALLVSAVDVATGIPMAWLIARRRSRWISVLDTLSDIPFIVPTAALGYSLLLFWNDPNSGVSRLFGASLVSEGWVLVILLHFAFSYPVVVRVVVGALLDYKREYENASRTLGAPPLTAARSVTLPIIKPSLIAAFILAFSRSISETGATLLVAGAFENGSTFIYNMGTNEGALVFASFLLIAGACAIFIATRLLAPRLKLPVKRMWPTFERKLSYSKATSSRDSVTLLIFFGIVLIPSVWVALPALQAVFTPTLSRSLAGAGIWAEYWQSLLLSYSLATIVTILNILIGLPMAVLVARKKIGNLPSAALDVLVNIPLVVPSIALGATLGPFWKEFNFIPQIMILIFAHLTITYPYFVRAMTAAVDRISLELEEASRTLGAKPLGVFRTIILPLTKYSILSGAVMVFTRSVSETGATKVVTSLRTAPVVLVDWVKQTISATKLDIGLGCGFLILFSFVILLALRLIIRGRGRY
jgi:thiamine transport system permease protein